MNTRATLRVAVPFALLAVVLFAQENPTPPPVTGEDKPAAAKPPMKQIGGLRFLDVSELTIVNVDVSVSDKKGPVVGLTADDFEIFHDRKPVPLTNFAAFTRRAAAPTPAPAPAATAVPTTPTPEPAPAPKREPRFVVFYIDNENLMPFNRNRVINRMVDWIENNLVAPDQAMVVSYQRSLKIIQPFTSDPGDIATALRSVRKYTGGRSDLINSRQRIEDDISQGSPQNSSSGQNNYARVLDETKSFSREVRNNLQFATRSLQDLVGSMSGLPGKKALIYVSDGLPMTPGAELYYAIQDAYQAPSVLSESHEFDSTDLYDSLVRTAISAGVTLYSIDARGLQSESGIEAENRQSRSPLAASMATSNYQDSLIYMASRTGGMAILNANDPTPGLDKIAADFETYYSLGYRLVPTGEDRMHRVEVKVKGHPEYKLVYKNSFIEKTLPTKIADRVVSGLAFDLQDNPLSIELKAGTPAPAEGQRWTLPVEVRVPFERIALIPDGADLIGFIMVYYAARDDEGKESDLQHTEHPIRIPASDYQAMRRDQFTVSTSLLVEPGVYRISVGVRDELTNQAGYALAKASVHPELK